MMFSLIHELLFFFKAPSLVTLLSLRNALEENFGTIFFFPRNYAVFAKLYFRGTSITLIKNLVFKLKGMLVCKVLYSISLNNTKESYFH